MGRQVRAKQRRWTADGAKSALLWHNLTTRARKLNLKRPDLKANDLARPHRTSYSYLKARTNEVKNTVASRFIYKRWTNRLIKGGETLVKRLEKSAKTKPDAQKTELIKRTKRATKKFVKTRDTVLKNPSAANKAASLHAVNSMVDNTKGTERHNPSNLPVSKQLQVNIELANANPKEGLLTPGSQVATDHTPRAGYEVAVDGKNNLILATGHLFPLKKVNAKHRKRLARHGFKFVKGFLPPTKKNGGFTFNLPPSKSIIP